MKWENHRGHSASLGTNNIPQFQRETIDANANINLFKDKNTRLDWGTSASHHTRGFNKGRTDFQTGLNFNHRF